MLSRRSFTLLLIGLGVSMFSVVDVSGAPSGKNDNGRKNGYVPPSKPNPPKKYAKPVMMDPAYQTMEAKTKVPEPVSDLDQNDSTLISVKDQIGKIDDHAKKNGWVSPNKSASTESTKVLKPVSESNVSEPETVLEHLSEPDHNDSIPMPISIKDQDGRIDYSALEAKAKRQGWVNLWNPQGGL
ncbi:uncharacterized protein LOC129568877 [Sitodiplosis mosellana]|uniref:uncharacterized protein LOC129568877 n=1 Tax=Sitodiplosis mosellana TaxID=263140 RepID=UPI00244497C6|nr:uncharacterized protein LOC129568877 [Sitodiplosis mosellana]